MRLGDENSYFELSVEFAHDVLEKAETSELRNGDPLSKWEFADRLRQME